MFGLAFQLLDKSGGDYKLDWYRIVQDRDNVIKTAVKSRTVSKFCRPTVDGGKEASWKVDHENYL